MIWTEEKKRIAREIISSAATNTEGFRDAGCALSCSSTSVRLQYERGRLGNIPPKRKPSKDDMAEHRRREEMSSLRDAKTRLLKDLSDAQSKIDALTELRRAKPLAPISAARGVGARQRQGVPVMMCSDWHVEERVNAATVNGANAYDLDIADACISTMADSFEWMLRDARYDCRTGVVWLGGDLFSGHIHEELAEGNFLSPVQAIVWVQERIERMLRRIALTTTLERIVVVCNDGNHGRATNKIRIATRTANSLEWLMYKTLAARMADDPRFEFHVADGAWSFLDVCGFELAFTHGDSFKSNGGVGGISIPIRRGIARMFQGRKLHQVCMGHFHQRSDFGDISINGSMIGWSPFAEYIHSAPEPRQQSWFLIDSERGKCITAPIWLPQTGTNETVAAA